MHAYGPSGIAGWPFLLLAGTTNYTLHGKNIVHMIQGGNNLHFFYDASNKPAIVEFNGTKYAYVHNLQGDIVAILDSNGTKVVEYKYDAWGKPFTPTGSMATSLGELNPFRYRGYVYDEEIGMYYVRSRYLCPDKARFINADSKTITAPLLGASMYAYTRSNPINMVDVDGKDAIWIQESGSAGGMGHSGLMVQDGDGNWHYFFWGPESETLDKDLVMGTPKFCYLEPIETRGATLSDKWSVVSAIENSAATAPEAAKRAELITDVYYFEGDYTATYDWVKEAVNNSEQYKVLGNNCVQQTMEAFRASDERFYLVGTVGLAAVVPNEAVMQVQMLPRKKGDYPLKLIINNAIQNYNLQPW